MKQKDKIMIFLIFKIINLNNNMNNNNINIILKMNIWMILILIKILKRKNLKVRTYFLQEVLLFLKLHLERNQIFLLIKFNNAKNAKVKFYDKFKINGKYKEGGVSKYYTHYYAHC